MIIPLITARARAVNDNLWAELLGDAPVSAARLAEIEAEYAACGAEQAREYLEDERLIREWERAMNWDVRGDDQC